MFPYNGGNLPQLAASVAPLETWGYRTIAVLIGGALATALLRRRGMPEKIVEPTRVAT